MADVHEEETVTVVFADISGSTALYQRVETAQAHAMISACLELLKTTVAENNGDFVHSRGDDVVCTFAETRDAFQTVRDMLARTDGADLLVHIGLDRGPVIRVRDDIFGNCVNVAARLSGLAKENEAFCTNTIRDALTDEQRSEVHFFDSRHLKGVSDAADVYRYATPSIEAGTQVLFGNSTDLDPLHERPQTMAQQTLVQLTHKGQVVRGGTGQRITIGRSDDCDMVLPFAWVSRQHASVEVRNAHVYLHDESSNGIYVVAEGQAPILLRRESMLLPTRCTLSPTTHPDEPGAKLIYCTVLNIGG
ncbi:MAG: adenylate/guanylate cyclase domain-containing protein [Pseudomonadota bacterium]